MLRDLYFPHYLIRHFLWIPTDFVTDFAWAGLGFAQGRLGSSGRRDVKDGVSCVPNDVRKNSKPRRRTRSRKVIEGATMVCPAWKRWQ